MDNRNMKEFVLLWSALMNVVRCRGYWQTSRYCLRFQTCARRANHAQAFTRLAALFAVLFFWGGVVYSACIKLWGVHKSICLVTCACVDMTPGPSKHKYFIVLYSLFLSLLSFFLFIKNWWWHMHWLFVSLCDFRKSFPNFQSSCIPISPNLQYRCLLWEYLNKKKDRKMYNVFVRLCNNEYLCIIFLWKVYMYEQFSVPLLFCGFLCWCWFCL